eukprot:4711698-Karenia_brevis.AAC.1
MARPEKANALAQTKQLAKASHNGLVSSMGLSMHSAEPKYPLTPVKLHEHRMRTTSGFLYYHGLS